MNDLALNRAYGRQHSDAPDELERTLAEVREFRQTIVKAWQARGVTLRRDERHRLRDEIQSTCDMLKDLTASD